MLGELAAGVYDGMRGAMYLVRTPRLWLYVLLPAVVAAALLFAVVGSVLALLNAPIAMLGSWLPTWAAGVLKLLAGIALTIASLAVLISVAAVIAGPFNEMLSESIEERVTGVAGPQFSVIHFVRDLVTGIWHALRRVALYLVVMLLLLVAGIVVPVVGTIIAAVLGALATARFASWDAYDAVWSRRRLRYRDKVAYLRAHRWRTWGLGASVAVVLVIPGLGVIGLAIGAAGATLRSLEVERAATAAAGATTRS